ncbi:MAG: PAS domain S-box protein [Anaerolineales bacterium]|nr:PAS domain S-box protein [Anaerolineales bacterium]
MRSAKSSHAFQKGRDDEQMVADGGNVEPLYRPREGPTKPPLAVSPPDREQNRDRERLCTLPGLEVWWDALHKTMEEGVVAFNRRGRITLFNPGAERITGWKADEALHASINLVFRLLQSEDNLQSLLASAEPLQPIQIRNREGKTLTLSMAVQEVESQRLDARGTLLVFRDITRDSAARDLRSHFLAKITHDFRTPLSAINASVEFLLEKFDQLTKEEVGVLLGSVHFSLTSLQTLIENLLESFSIEAGHFTVRLRPTRLVDVVFEAISVMEPLLNRRRQRVCVNRLGALPLVKADSTRLKQVLVNLLSNASKYGPLEQVIEIKIRPSGEMIRLSVIDEGPGIPFNKRKDLFKPFVRLSTQDGAQHGVGLGLSVVKAIVDEHGGEVGFDENRQGGSIFWFTVPKLETRNESAHCRR